VRHDGDRHYAGDRAHRRVDGAEATGGRRRRVADADVALHGEQDRQPDGRRVENGRQVVGEAVVGEAPAGRDPVGVAAEHVEVDVARQRPDAGHRCRHRQSHEDDVGLVQSLILFIRRLFD